MGSVHALLLGYSTSRVALRNQIARKSRAALLHESGPPLENELKEGRRPFQPKNKKSTPTNAIKNKEDPSQRANCSTEHNVAVNTQKRCIHI